MSSDYRGTLGQQPNQSRPGYPPPVSPNRSWMANPLFWLIIVGSVVVLLVGVLVVGYVTYKALGQDTPEKTVDAYLGAVKEHNIPAAYEQLCDQSLNSISVNEDFTGDADFARWEIVGVKRTAAVAEVSVEVVGRGESGRLKVVSSPY